MQRKIIGFMIAWFVFTAGPAVAQDSGWESMGVVERDIRVLLVGSDNRKIFAGGHGSLFKSDDGGKNWRRVLYIRGGSKRINALEFDSLDENSVYAATGNGLYRSKDSGNRWVRIFSGKNGMERECTAVYGLSNTIFSGTRGGLFISRDGGGSWEKKDGYIGKSCVLNFDYSAGGKTMYLAADAGIFRSLNNGEDWKRVFVQWGRETQDDDSADDGGKEGDTAGIFRINFVKTDANNVNCVYFSSSQGVYRSTNQGDTWNRLTDYGLLSTDVRLMSLSGDSRIYALTPAGIFTLYAGHWAEVSSGLAAGKLSYFSLGGNGDIYVAGEKGVFRRRNAGEGNHFGRGMLRDYLECEPKIKDVQDMAIRYAEVSPDKISQWRKSAGKKALLPKVTVGLDRNSTDLWHWESGSSSTSGDDLLRHGKESIDWDVSLSWDLSDLIWNDAQTSIDVRSKLMVELREDILDQVNKLYFERLRVKFELDNLGMDESGKRFDKQLKLEELTASLDSLTAGHYSEQLLRMAEERHG